MELEDLIAKLDQNPALGSRNLYEILVTIRTKYMDQNVKLIQNGAITKLVQHLKRPNAKIVDVVLSILGNLLMQSEARKQMKPHLRILTSILSSIDEEAILGRTCRVCANVAQDPENGRILKNLGLLNILIKTLTELKTPKAKSAAVRAIKILGAFEKRETLLSSNAIITVSAQLSSEDEDLLKQVTKCLAKFTSGANRCDQFMAMQIQGEEGHGFQRLVELTKSWNSNRTIWENALTTLVNLSFCCALRPNLGNAGVIWLFIFRCNNEYDKLAPGDFFRTVSALCLYCHESVNRMKVISHKIISEIYL